MSSALPGTDDGLVAIGASFSAGAAVGAGVGEGAADAAAAGAGLRRRTMRAVRPFPLPGGILAVTTVGAFLDLADQFGPPTGFFWDVTALSITGFTAGAVGVSKNGPYVTPAGNAATLDPVWLFSAAGSQAFPQKGIPLLDASERLVFTVTSALTGAAQISGQVIAVPAERIDEYLS